MKAVANFINDAAKAVLGGLAAGVGAATIYIQASPLTDPSDWQPWLAGAAVAGGTGFITYMTTNRTPSA